MIPLARPQAPGNLSRGTGCRGEARVDRCPEPGKSRWITDVPDPVVRPSQGVGITRSDYRQGCCGSGPAAGWIPPERPAVLPFGPTAPEDSDPSGLPSRFDSYLRLCSSDISPDDGIHEDHGVGYRNRLCRPFAREPTVNRRPSGRPTADG